MIQYVSITHNQKNNYIFHINKFVFMDAFAKTAQRIHDYKLSIWLYDEILKDRKKVDNYSTLTIYQRAISKYHIQDYDGALEDFNTVIIENDSSGSLITNNRLIFVDQWIEKIYSIIRKDNDERDHDDDPEYHRAMEEAWKKGN